MREKQTKPIEGKYLDIGIFFFFKKKKEKKKKKKVVGLHQPY